MAQALKLGLEDYCLFGEKAAMRGEDADRKFVWMPLDPESAIEPAEDAIVIESPQATVVAPVPSPVKPRSVSPMSEATTTAQAESNGQAKSETKATKTSRQDAQQDVGSLIEQAVQFRLALHNLVQQANGLVKALKHHRRQNKALADTLASIKQLKTLGV